MRTSHLCVVVVCLQSTIAFPQFDVSGRPRFDKTRLPEQNGTSSFIKRSGTGEHAQFEQPAAPADEDALEKWVDWTDEDFKDAATRGRALSQFMMEPSVKRIDQAVQKSGSVPKGQGSQSPFTGYSELYAGGWTKQKLNLDNPMDPYNFDTSTALAPILKDLGLSLKPKTPKRPDGDHEPVEWKQTDRRFDGKVHKIPTFGSYYSTFNPKQGVIIAISAYNPKSEIIKSWYDEFESDDESGEAEIERRTKNIESYIPKLNKFSDVTFLEWQEQCRKTGINPNTLRYMFLYTLTTKITNHVIEYILKQKGIESNPWRNEEDQGNYRAPEWAQRITLTPKDEGFNAILKSPQGAMVGWMLVQHREELGHKRIAKMHIFKDAHPKLQYQGPSMLMELENLDKNGKPVPWSKSAAHQEGHAGPSGAQAHSSGRKDSAAGSHSRRHVKTLAVRADHEGDVPMIDAASRASSATPEHDPSTLHPPLTDAEFKMQVKKGQQFYEWMSIPTTEQLDQAMRKAGKLPQGQSSQSVFVAPDALDKGGWFDDANAQHRGDLDDRIFNLGNPVGAVLRSLEMSTKSRESGGANEVSHIHQDESFFDGEHHTFPTEGNVYAIYNTKDGMLISVLAESPQTALPRTLEQHGLKDQQIRNYVQNVQNYPRLQRLSDLLFLRYSEAAQETGDDVKKLRYIMSLAVYQSDTIQMIDYILKSKGEKADPWTTSLGHSGEYRVPQWPATLDFTRRDKDPSNFYALINRINANVWLLLQHRKQLGVKRISKISLFHGPLRPDSRKYPGPSMLIELENLDSEGRVVGWPKYSLREKPGAQAGSSRAQAGSSSGHGRRRGLSRL